MPREGTETLFSDAPKKGDEIRLVRPAKFQTLHGVGIHSVGTPGLVTSAGEGAVFANVGGYEMELLPGEYEVTRRA